MSIAPPNGMSWAGRPLANVVTLPVAGSTRRTRPVAPSVRYRAPSGPMVLPEPPLSPVTRLWAPRLDCAVADGDDVLLPRCMKACDPVAWLIALAEPDTARLASTIRPETTSRRPGRTSPAGRDS